MRFHDIRVWLCASFLTPLVIAISLATASAQITSRWVNPVNGDWGDATKWSTPDFPNNGSPSPGSRYHAVIDAVGGPYQVTLRNSVTVDRVTLDSPDSILHLLDGDLNLVERTGTGNEKSVGK